MLYLSKMMELKEEVKTEDEKTTMEWEVKELEEQIA